MNQTFIGGYWKNRQEDINAVASKIEFFLKELQKVDEIFSSFMLPAHSKKKAISNVFNISTSNITLELQKRRKKNEIDNQGFCKIGFSIMLFNESNSYSTIVSFTIGASSEYLNNVCYISFKGKVLGEEKILKIQHLIKEKFNPEILKVEV